MQREVRMAIARGITGFTFDVMSANGDAQLQMLLDAAQSVDPRFKILVMPDISALKSNARSGGRAASPPQRAARRHIGSAMAGWSSPLLTRARIRPIGGPA